MTIRYTLLDSIQLCIYVNEIVNLLFKLSYQYLFGFIVKPYVRILWISLRSVTIK